MNQKKAVFQVFHGKSIGTDPYFVLNEEKYPIFYHPPFIYWGYNNRLFFGTYSTFTTWEDSFYDTDELAAGVSYSLTKSLFRGEVASGFVQPKHFHILPHLLGVIILPNLWR